MDPDFMTRYLPEHGAARQTGHGDPTAEPDLTDPSVAEPGADIDAGQPPNGRGDETTAVLPPDVHAAVRARTPRPGPQPPQPGPRPPQPTTPPPPAAPTTTSEPAAVDP